MERWDYYFPFKTEKKIKQEQSGGIKKSKLILAQVFKRQRQEEEEQIETQVAQIVDKDPFNLSNDDYYLPKNNPRTQVKSYEGEDMWEKREVHLFFFLEGS